MGYMILDEAMILCQGSSFLEESGSLGMGFMSINFILLSLCFSFFYQPCLLQPLTFVLLPFIFCLVHPPSLSIIFKENCC